MQARKNYYYKITGIDSNDTSTSLAGSFYNYNSSNSRNISLRTLADVATEGSEIIKFELYDSRNYSNLLGSISTTLNDTSIEPKVNLTYGTTTIKTARQRLMKGPITLSDCPTWVERITIGSLMVSILMILEALQAATFILILKMDPERFR